MRRICDNLLVPIITLLLYLKFKQTWLLKFITRRVLITMKLELTISLASPIFVMGRTLPN